MLLTHLVLSILPLLTVGEVYCPPNGPLVPRPTALASSPIIQDALNNLPDTLNRALNGTIQAGWNVPNTSFSLAIVTYDNPPDQPLWEFHHRGSANTRGVEIVDGNSQYLIGSISKLISDALFQRAGIDWESPITKWLPQLASNQSKISWQNITLGQLGEHLAGIPPNSGFSEYYFLNSVFTALGFPNLTMEDYPTCGVTGLNQACDRQQTIEQLLEFYPVASPNDGPVYSQLSFTIISYALEVALGKNYTQILEEYFSTPLNLSSTIPSPGDDAKAVIPPGENSWGGVYGDGAPGGGLVSTTNDLARMVHSILTYTIFDTETEVKAWLKPAVETSSLTTLVGRPWEIIRSDKVVPGQVTDIYSKGGGAYGYGSHLSLVDKYGIGFVVLKAGPAGAEFLLADALFATVLPAVEREARKQAEAYTGRYRYAVSGTEFNANFTMDSGPGIRLSNLTSNGKDILAGIQGIWPYTGVGLVGNLTDNFRLYPTGLEISNVISSNGRVFTREVWRMTFDVQADPSNQSDLPSAGVIGDYCVTWQTIDWIHYGREPIDRFIFLRDAETREVAGLEIPFLRASLSKST